MTEELFREESYLKTCEAEVVAANADGIELDRTVFYAAGGGQPGDTGTLKTASGMEISIADTIKDKGTGAILHIPTEDAPALQPGDAVSATIDWGRRHRHMRMHTCLHLLCGLVEGGVTGGSVGADKSRLDFDIPGDVPDKADLTVRLNALIAEDHPLAVRWISDADLAAEPDLVRTMSVKPPTGSGRVRLIDVEGVDLQPCGGTHVKSTGEIGRVRISKIENKGKRNRRINVVFDE